MSRSGTTLTRHKLVHSMFLLDACFVVGLLSLTLRCNCWHCVLGFVVFVAACHCSRVNSTALRLCNAVISVTVSEWRLVRKMLYCKVMSSAVDVQQELRLSRARKLPSMGRSLLGTDRQTLPHTFSTQRFSTCAKYHPVLCCQGPSRDTRGQRRHVFATLRFADSKSTHTALFRARPTTQESS
jgi:hypothetical protein